MNAGHCFMPPWIHTVVSPPGPFLGSALFSVHFGAPFPSACTVDIGQLEAGYFCPFLLWSASQEVCLVGEDDERES